MFFDLAGRKVAVAGEGLAADRRAEIARSAGAQVVRLAATATAADFRGAAAAFISTGTLEGDTALQRAAKAAAAA